MRVSPRPVVSAATGLTLTAGLLVGVGAVEVVQAPPASAAVIIATACGDTNGHGFVQYQNGSSGAQKCVIIKDGPIGPQIYWSKPAGVPSLDGYIFGGGGGGGGATTSGTCGRIGNFSRTTTFSTTTDLYLVVGNGGGRAEYASPSNPNWNGFQGGQSWVQTQSKFSDGGLPGSGNLANSGSTCALDPANQGTRSDGIWTQYGNCLLYTSPSPRDS